MDDGMERPRFVGSLDADGDASVQRSLVGALSAHNVDLQMAAAGPVIASGDVSIQQGGCGPVLCAGDVSIHQGGSGPILTKGNVSITQGGTQSVIAREARLGASSFVGIVASPNVTMEDGAKVLMGTKQATAFGAALGAVVGGILLLRGRR